MSTTFEFEAIGTHWKIDIYKELSSAEESSLLKEILDRIGIFDKNYSRFRQDSLVTLMSQKAGEYILPDDAEKMLSLYQKMFDLTDGRVTPLIGDVLVAAGYDAEYSLVEKTLTAPQAWKDTLGYSHPRLTIKQPVLLDFGAAGKGYLVDIIGEVLMQNNVDSFCIDAGGDILHRHDENILRVGLENPDNAKEVIGIAFVKNESICGSAGNRRRWGNFHHIIDPTTLTSVDNISAVWTVAKTALIADMLATALFFVAPEVLLEYFDFEYLVVQSDKTFHKSGGFAVELFS